MTGLDFSNKVHELFCFGVDVLVVKIGHLSEISHHASLFHQSENAFFLTCCLTSSYDFRGELNGLELKFLAAS